jgi:hypothetical protein
MKQKHVKHLPKSAAAETVGWIGAVCILSGYAGISVGFLDGDSWFYHASLLLGSIGLCIVTYRHRAFQSVLVNSIFASLAVVAIFRIFFFA